MALSFTTNLAPLAPDLKEACGLPWACVVQPFAPPTQPQDALLPAADVARCHECYSYICRQCFFQRNGWVCALCGTLNEFASIHNQRYLNAEARGTFAELRYNSVEAECSLLPGDSDEVHEEEEEEVWEVEAAPLYVALVDAACSPEFMEVVRSALLAALEALPPAALFGLITVAEEVGLHEALESGPSVHYVPVLPAGPDPTTVELQEALPLASLLAPVGTKKEAIATMLEAMQSHPPPDEAAEGEEEGEGDALLKGPRRGMGSAVQAVMRYLGSAAAEQRAAGGEGAVGQGAQTHAAYTGARLMLFLSGPPTFGRGSVVALRSALAPPQESELKLEPLLLDPVYPELTAWTLAKPEEGSQRAKAAAAASKGRGPAKRGQQAAGQNGKAAEGKEEEEVVEVVIDLGHATHDGKGDELVVNLEAATFYEEAGLAAAALGVCVDIYAVCVAFVGLELVQPLAGRSGGVVRLYTQPEDAPLPQDLYKRLCTPHAFGCLLRLRTSPELAVAPRCHGNAAPDPHYANLFRIPACGPADTFALDLRHTSRDGFGDPTAGVPVLQLVFQYSVLAPAMAGDGEDEQEGSRHGPGGGRRYALRRRLRITTVSLGVASSPLQLYTACDAPTTALVLMHKVLGAAAAEGSLGGARVLLREWLAALAASSSAVLASQDADLSKAAATGRRRGAAEKEEQQEGGGEGSSEGKQVVVMPQHRFSSRIDASFAALEALQPLPRLVYGLLASPLLHGYRPGRHPDEACALTSLWSSLPPGELSKAIYPQLSSWASPSEPAFPRHSLSRAAVELSGQPLFLLDAYSEVVIYYNPAAVAADAAHITFPPPQGTALRSAVNSLRQGRAVMPRLRMVQEGAGDTSPFWRWMIEDGGPELQTFLEFLTQVEGEAAQMM